MWSQKASLDSQYCVHHVKLIDTGAFGVEAGGVGHVRLREDRRHARPLAWIRLRAVAPNRCGRLSARSESIL